MRNIYTAFNYCIKCNCQSYKNKEIQGANTQRREKEEQYTNNQYNMISLLIGCVCVPFLISLDPPLSEHRQHVIPNVIGCLNAKDFFSG